MLLAAAQDGELRLALPPAVKQVFWRVVLISNLALLNSGSTLHPVYITFTRVVKLSSDGRFKEAYHVLMKDQNASVAGFHRFSDAVTLIALLSVVGASIYGASRTVAALADYG
ncbi:hypothetical protein G647_01482 [Cladophialophora carrionii CBS 160.54]|uniref:Amino acid permease/ SLC12A domain-containing protein n=1 Tax=Cladophialophora carrionii CBS 160.54 TaxID=1279043 RepID=V9DQ36_9EURO|nr:uncharacterized protein G647_01482 [Cladophialophora carrionii CBS 160.54]ETI29029.1 hypothetical protein G647_01482 [Cladophialophora carrionii CBS 160.54]